MNPEYLSKSGLYRAYIESDSDADVSTTFSQEIAKWGMAENEIETLVYNFRSIEFTRANVYKYLDFVCFFDFDIMKELIEYVVLTWMVKNDLHEAICGISQVYTIIDNLIFGQKIKKLDLAVYLCKHYEINEIKNKDWQCTVVDDEIYLLFHNNFNESVTIPNGITHLIFGEEYRQMAEIPNSVTHLTFKWCFNQSIIIPNSITHLTFGYECNQQTIIPNSVTHLTFGRYSAHTSIPNSVTHLIFGYGHDTPLLFYRNINALT